MASARARLIISKGVNRLMAGGPGHERARLIRQALVEVAQRWAANTLPEHFRRQAFTRWPDAYVWRTRNYDARKRRRFGHADPMVYSGRFRQEVLGRPPAIVHRADGRSVRVRLLIPWGRAGNFWAGGPRRHDFRQSVTAVSQAEWRAMSREFSAALERLIRASERLMRASVSGGGSA